MRAAIIATILVIGLPLPLTAGAVAQQTVAPGNSAPETDARGIPVVSDPATAPAGTNQAPPPGAWIVPAPNQAAAFATQPSTGEKPPCSRTVTDNCTQTYEVGRRGRGGTCPNPDYPNDPDCPRHARSPR